MTPWVARIVYANVAMFLLTGVFRVIPEAPLVFRPVLVLSQPWTPVTYMFLHAGFGHIFFNMLALYFFGPRLEARLGSRPFLGLYFTSGIMGAMLSVVTPRVAIIGASAAVFGVLLGFARYWPRDKIYIWAVLPIEARTLVVLMAVFSLYAGFSGRGGGIAHLAHLGGFVGGFLYLKWWERRSPAARFQAKARAPAARPRTVESTDIRRWSQISQKDLHPVNREELDRVLDKINQSGVASLSADERDFLERLAAK
ncbi:MAG: rhomboid family intramembrane serine protease [Gemmatimonadales bacterium]